MDLPSFTIDPTTTFSELLGNVVDSELEAEFMANAAVTFTPNIGANDFVVWEEQFYRVQPVKAYINEAGQIEREYESGGVGPVLLLANNPDLNVSNVQWTITVKVGKTFLRAWTFNALDDGETLNLASVAPLANIPAKDIARGPRGITPWFVPVPDTDPQLFQAMSPDGAVGEPIQLDTVLMLEEFFEIAGVTEVGEGVLVAGSEKAGRDALGAVGFDDPYGPIDLRRMHPKIAAGQWQTTLGAAYTSGQYTMTKPGGWSAADVGKIVIANEDPTSPGIFKRWMGKILSVNGGGVATLDTAAPSTVEGQRIVYGFDITVELNAALAAIAILGFNPREAYLPGYYRLSQLVIPRGVNFRGAGWGWHANINPLLSPVGTLLHQLPGSQKNFLVFSNPLVSGDKSWMGPVGVKQIALQGPEVNVRDKAPTIGFGFAMRGADGTAYTPQDGCDFDWIRVFNFPQGGAEFPKGVVPVTPDQFQCIFNGGSGSGYGFDFTLDPDTGQRLHLSDPSADGNVSGGAIFRNGGPGGSIIVTAFKGEAVTGGFFGEITGYAAVEGWAGVGSNIQRAVLTFENCDRTPVDANGISNIQQGISSKSPGPAMRIISDSDKVPNITFAAIGTRVTSSQLADSADAVTIRDEVNGIDIPRTVTSGVYPMSASNLGRGQQSVTTAETLGHFNDLTVFIGSAGAPTLPSAVGMKGARCRLVNVHTSSVTATVNAGSVTILPGAWVVYESNNSTWVRMESATTAQVIHAATSKSTPVDADEFYVADSENSWDGRKTTFANIKSRIKAYLEGLTGAGLTSLVLTTPKVVNYIADSAGAILVGLNSVASAVNYLQISNRATGQKPSITATGSDTDVYGNLASKGAGYWSMNNNEIMTAVRGVNPQTGTTYTLAATDAGRTVTLDNASAITLTVPTNGTVTMVNGTRIELSTLGAGTVTVSPAGGVTVNGIPGLKIPQYATGTLTKISANVWLLTGAGLTA